MELPFLKEFRIGEYTITSIVIDELWKENCYLVTNTGTGEQILVDPGFDAEFIGQKVVESGAGNLRSILFTHGHFDHVGAAEVLAARFKVSSNIHKADVRLLRHAPFYALSYGKQTITTPKRFVSFDSHPDIVIGGDSVAVIETPGHTAGSVCYSFPGFVFTGDTLLKGYIGRTDQPGGDDSAIIGSVKMLLERLSSDVVIFPGHGKPWTVADASLWFADVGALAPKHEEFIH